MFSARNMTALNYNVSFLQLGGRVRSGGVVGDTLKQALLGPQAVDLSRPPSQRTAHLNVGLLKDPIELKGLTLMHHFSNWVGV